jgi:DNA (cytosine-5)-methyltransferase 1
MAVELDVRWILFENVRGLLTARGSDGTPGSALKLIRSKLLSAGFQTAVSLLNAADYGLPQRRVRLFVIGYRSGDAPQFPKATHSAMCELSGLGSEPWVCLRDCLSEVTPLSADEIIRPSGRMATELKNIAPGTGVKSQGKIESTRPGGHWGYKQGAFVADLDLPARTITASAQQDWIIDPKLGLRRLCPRECAAIQTFPKEWVFIGNSATQYRLIGNAVPPNLALVVGKALLSHTKKPDRVTKRPAFTDLLPLAPQLAAAIRYTAKEEARNGASRKMAPSKRVYRFPRVEAQIG